MKTIAYVVRKVGLHRGTPRVWLEGRQPAKAGFSPGCRYDIVVTGKTVVLRLAKAGAYVVSKKLKADVLQPVIDLKLKQVFDGCSTVKVTFHNDQIVITPVASEQSRTERRERLSAKLRSGETLAVGSLCHGGGVLSHGVHTGANQAGVKTRLAFALEMREELLEQAQSVNQAWDSNTMLIAAPLQEVAFDFSLALPKVEILEMGLPCSGASAAGKSARHLVHAESHPDVGFLIAPALAIVARVNPAVIIFENVPAYAKTASGAILRGQLSAMGYTLHDTILKGHEFGALENRKRWCLVAVTEGVTFDFANLARTTTQTRLGECLDCTIMDNDPRWKEMTYLKEKEKRDLAAGKNWRMQIVTAESTTVPTLTKGYAKNRSTDPKLAHPTDPNLLRLLTPAECARIMRIPAHLIAGITSKTMAHEILGQSVVHSAFAAVAKALGDALQAFDHAATGSQKTTEEVG